VHELITEPGETIPVGTVMAKFLAPGERAIAAAMSRSKREIPHYYLSDTIPLGRAAAWLARENAARPVTGRLLMAALYLKAVARACARHPDMNGFFRDGSLRSSEISSPTITVTNLGDEGVEAVHGVIYPPQVALVGFGKAGERPWVEEGRLCAMRAVTATLAADHRVSNGHRGALFLAEIHRLLQAPEAL